MASYMDLIITPIGSLKAEPGETVCKDARNDLFNFSYSVLVQSLSLKVMIWLFD